MIAMIMPAGIALFMYIESWELCTSQDVVYTQKLVIYVTQPLPQEIKDVGTVLCTKRGEKGVLHILGMICHTACYDILST